MDSSRPPTVGCMDLPATLARSLRTFPPDVAESWVATLPARLEQAADRWNIEIGEPFEPGGVTSYVAPAVDDAGRRLVYKITVPHAESRAEAMALRAYAGNGAVRLEAHASESWELLLERADPGTDLWAADAAQCDEVACELARRLWQESDDEGIPTVAATASAWADVTERRLITSDVPWITEPVERGVDLLRTLPHESGDRMLLHGDFHPGNILAARREPWLVIDPKPLIGDPAFEPIQLLIQQDGRIVEPSDVVTVERRLDDLAKRLGLDPVRIGRWGMARCAEWSMWSWDHGDTVDAAIAYTWVRTLDRLV